MERIATDDIALNAEKYPEEPSSDERKSSRSGRQKVFSNKLIHAYQARHFYLFNILPLLLTLILIPFAVAYPPGKLEALMFFGFWLIGGLGISVGYHRLFSHRSFSASRPLKVVLAIFGELAAQGPLLSWCAIHRRHHENSDRAGDPHSPNTEDIRHKSTLFRFLHAQILWMKRHEYPNVVHYVPDLLKDKDLRTIDSYYSMIVGAGFLLPGLIGWYYYGSGEGVLSAMFWGSLLRTTVFSNLIWTINSLCHLTGSRQFQTNDKSRNISLLSIPTFGESLHNNHHYRPGSAKFCTHTWQVDIGYWFIRMFSILGIASDVKTTIDGSER